MGALRNPALGSPVGNGHHWTQFSRITSRRKGRTDWNRIPAVYQHDHLLPSRTLSNDPRTIFAGPEWINHSTVYRPSSKPQLETLYLENNLHRNSHFSSILGILRTTATGAVSRASDIWISLCVRGQPFPERPLLSRRAIFFTRGTIQLPPTQKPLPL